MKLNVHRFEVTGTFTTVNKTTSTCHIMALILAFRWRHLANTDLRDAYWAVHLAVRCLLPLRPTL